MLQRIKDYVKTKPRIYDLAARARRLVGFRGELYDCLDNFSRSQSQCVRVLQVGASDGLRNDPVREFIVRDRWQGILVEPLPYAFNALLANYRYLAVNRLVFVNAAVSANSCDDILFWTFKDRFLYSLSEELRIDFIQKSSFDLRHLEREFGKRADFKEIVQEVKVRCLTLMDVVKEYGGGTGPDLLVIDAEGHESAILQSIDFQIVDPKAILFESSHLGASQDETFTFLSHHGYTCKTFGWDTFAISDKVAIASRSGRNTVR